MLEVAYLKLKTYEKFLNIWLLFEGNWNSLIMLPLSSWISMIFNWCIRYPIQLTTKLCKKCFAILTHVQLKIILCKCSYFIYTDKRIFCSVSEYVCLFVMANNIYGTYEAENLCMHTSLFTHWKLAKKFFHFYVCFLKVLL